ncbi:MAG TPA: CRISPR-associated protein Cas4 [bacterium]|nr:CRISPR-associated protein Cas4 [bacterium]HQJ64142.1 CRISPR-associated protein Cas4 [bacterium]
MDDEEYLTISGLQHLLFCPRQFALIYIEREWMENVLTARGRIEHERVDQGYKECRKGRRQFSGLLIRSEQLRLQGKLDVLELDLIDASAPDNLQQLGLRGEWRVYPVEFKHGEPKVNDCDRVQLCAQVLCLEEMFSLSIGTAFLFYQRVKHREEVRLDQALRAKTIQAAEALHRLFIAAKTPPPHYSAKCRSCSMIDVCMPKKLSATTNNYRQILFNPQAPAV